MSDFLLSAWCVGMWKSQFCQMLLIILLFIKWELFLMFKILLKWVKEWVKFIYFEILQFFNYKHIHNLNILTNTEKNKYFVFKKIWFVANYLHYKTKL